MSNEDGLKVGRITLPTTIDATSAYSVSAAPPPLNLTKLAEQAQRNTEAIERLAATLERLERLLQREREQRRMTEGL